MKLIFRRLITEKRKSAFKCPYRHRRTRSSTPDLLSPYLLGPELFISPPILTIQTRPAYSSARFDSSSASSFLIGYSPVVNPMATPTSNLIPSSSGSFYTESSVVKDLSVRSTAQFVLPLQIDWYGPSRPSTLYMVPAQSNYMTSTSSNPQSGVQRFFQEFRLPDYTLDSFSGRLLDVVSSTTFSSGDVQAELHHAITRLMVFTCVFETLISFVRLFCIWVFEFLYAIFCIYRLFDIYEPFH